MHLGDPTAPVTPYLFPCNATLLPPSPFACPVKILGSPPDGFQGFGRVLLDSVLNVRGSVDLFVEDPVDMTHGEVHSYFIDMDGISSSAFDGDMKVGGREGGGAGGREGIEYKPGKRGDS